MDESFHLILHYCRFFLDLILPRSGISHLHYCNDAVSHPARNFHMVFPKRITPEENSMGILGRIHHWLSKLPERCIDNIRCTLKTIGQLSIGPAFGILFICHPGNAHILFGPAVLISMHEKVRCNIFVINVCGIFRPSRKLHEFHTLPYS